MIAAMYSAGFCFVAAVSMAALARLTLWPLEAFSLASWPPAFLPRTSRPRLKKSRSAIDGSTGAAPEALASGICGCGCEEDARALPCSAGWHCWSFASALPAECLAAAPRLPASERRSYFSADLANSSSIRLWRHPGSNSSAMTERESSHSASVMLAMRAKRASSLGREPNVQYCMIRSR